MTLLREHPYTIMNGYYRVFELRCGKVIMLHREGESVVNRITWPDRAAWQTYDDYWFKWTKAQQNAVNFWDIAGEKTQREYWYDEPYHVVKLRQQNAAQQQRITELEAHLNTRNLAVERDGDPLREKLNTLVKRYGAIRENMGRFSVGTDQHMNACKEADKVLEELEARLSTLVDTVRVLVRDNTNTFKDNRRYKAALEELQRRVTGLVYDKHVSKMALRQIVAHISFALSGVLEGGAE